MSLDIREPKADEAAAISDLLNEHAETAFGETEIAEPEVRRWFAMPEIWIRVAERDGRLVGYVDALRRGEAQAMELDKNCALLQRDSANDEVASPPDEVPALLSWWPPRSK